MRRQSYSMPGGTLSALHYNESAGPVRLVFAHANGFNGQSYRAIFEKIEAHCVALDLRGHGFTDLPTDPESLLNWDVFAGDIATFVGRYVPGKIVLAGHSMGAVSTILSAPQLIDNAAGYVGFDPVLMPWLGRQWPKIPGGRAYMKRRVPLIRNAGQRRRQFDSKEAVFERYKDRGAFKGMSECTLRNYIDGGFLAYDDGVSLKCDPLWEQAIFCAQAHNVFEAAKCLSKNAELHFAGKYGVSSKSTRSKLGRIIGMDTIHFEKNLNHMFPLQDSDYAAEILARVIKRADLE